MLNGAWKHDHSLPVLKSLHWLFMKYRIDLKMLLITCMGLLYPSLHSYFQSYEKKFQASSVAVPNLWNSFTLHIRLSTFAISIQSPLWPFQFLFHSLCHFPQCIFCFTFKIFFTLLLLLVVHYLLNDDDDDDDDVQHFGQ